MEGFLLTKCPATSHKYQSTEGTQTRQHALIFHWRSSQLLIYLFTGSHTHSSVDYILRSDWFCDIFRGQDSCKWRLLPEIWIPLRFLYNASFHCLSSCVLFIQKLSCCQTKRDSVENSHLGPLCYVSGECDPNQGPYNTSLIRSSWTTILLMEQTFFPLHCQLYEGW